MAWTVNGVVVATDRGWTIDANAHVEKRKKYGNGKMNSGPCGWKAKPSAMLSRSLAERSGIKPTVKKPSVAK